MSANNTLLAETAGLAVSENSTSAMSSNSELQSAPLRDSNFRDLNLRDLNPEQKEAVLHGAGPLLVFAGAGSGKTRVLTRRIVNLIIEHGARPSEIFAVTFTNKAAREMKERIARLFAEHQLSGPNSSGQGFYSNPSQLWVSTFHAACVRILRSHARLLDYSPGFVIYDSQDAMSALKRSYKKRNIDPKLYEPRMVMSMIDKAKNEYKFPADLKNSLYLSKEITQVVAELYEAYQEELKASNAMDFGDLICNVVTLFKLEPAVLQSYQQKFKYVLIDEYQDTNRVQYLLIRQLTENHNNICVVGDDDQSIYGFRGANVETILNFKKDFPGAKTVTLSTNYRSTKNILTAANAVIEKNKRREKKKMRTDNQPGAPVYLYRAFDEQDEAEFVVREISSWLRRETEPKDIAIFYRTNAQSRAIEEELLGAGLPYQIFGGHKFYDRKEIKDLMAYFRLLLNPKDNEAFIRIINTPTRGIGATAVGLVTNHAKTLDSSFFEALENIVNTKPSAVSKAQLSKFSAFLDLIRFLDLERQASEALLANVEGKHSPLEIRDAIANLLSKIAKHSGYLAQLELQDNLDSEGRIENIQELFRVAVDFVERSQDQEHRPSLNEFLDRASLSSDLEEENTAKAKDKASALKGMISLMTLHLAKGLEFDVVFMLGLDEGLLPHVRAIDNEVELEEERRLCYVGITRARKQLYLTRATDRTNFGRANWFTGLPSRFLKDLPGEVVKDYGKR